MLPQDNVTLKFLLEATGDVSTSDVDLAVASKAIIVGFNVKAPGSVKSYADNKAVEIRLYRVIYELIDDIRNAMEGLLEPVEVNQHILKFITLLYIIHMHIYVSAQQNDFTWHLNTIKLVKISYRHVNLIYTVSKGYLEIYIIVPIWL